MMGLGLTLMLPALWHAGVVVIQKLLACCCVMRVIMASIWGAWACAGVASLVGCGFVPTANQML
jgi:hypothetical protein